MLWWQQHLTKVQGYAQKLCFWQWNKGCKARLTQFSILVLIYFVTGMLLGNFPVFLHLQSWIVIIYLARLFQGLKKIMCLQLQAHNCVQQMIASILFLVT